MVVERVDVVASELARDTLERIDYQDSYQAVVPGATLDVVIAALRDLPGWMRGLLRGRDRVVRLFGLRPTDDALFAELARSPDEVVLGGDDRHLDFRIAVRVRGD